LSNPRCENGGMKNNLITVERRGRLRVEPDISFIVADPDADWVASRRAEVEQQVNQLHTQRDALD